MTSLLTDRDALTTEALSDLGYAPVVVTNRRCVRAGIDARDRDMRRAMASWIDRLRRENNPPNRPHNPNEGSAQTVIGAALIEAQIAGAEVFAVGCFGPRWRDDIDTSPPRPHESNVAAGVSSPGYATGVTAETERVAPDGGGGCPSDDDGNGPASADAERNPPSAATPRRSAR